MAQFRRADIREILGDACTDEIENRLISLHLGVVDPLKDDLTRYKKDAEKLPGVQQELDALKNGEDWKTKYETEHTAFEQYKADAAAREQAGQVKAAYRQLLVDTKVDETLLDTILAATDFKEMKLGEDGKLEGADKLTEAIKAKWGKFVVEDGKKGAEVDDPPKKKPEGFAGMTLTEKMAYANTHADDPAVVEWLRK